jgi:4-amino-4-deoxy-L-arabinose transferase-like glycosyltransferase
VLALSPVAALMFRFNNPDALLVLLMTAAAYTLVRAIDNGRTKWLVFTGLLLGFAFLAKMLQAFLVVPGFAVAYLWAGPPRLGKRIWQTVLMVAGIIAGAGWWIVAAELTPAAEDRPPRSVVAEAKLCARYEQSRFAGARRRADQSLSGTGRSPRPGRRSPRGLRRPRPR